MPVFRDVTLTWGGKDYSVTPSMSIIRRCETKGFRLTRMLNSFKDGEPEIGMLGLLISELLQAAGAKVTEDDVGAFMLGGGSDGEISALCEQAVMAFVSEQDAKKPEAPAK